jgi:hypothetical protein
VECAPSSILRDLIYPSIYRSTIAARLRSSECLEFRSRSWSAVPKVERPAKCTVGTARQTHFQAAGACRFTSRSASWVSKASAASVTCRRFYRGEQRRSGNFATASTSDSTFSQPDREHSVPPGCGGKPPINTPLCRRWSFASLTASESIHRSSAESKRDHKRSEQRQPSNPFRVVFLEETPWWRSLLPKRLMARRRRATRKQWTHLEHWENDHGS